MPIKQVVCCDKCGEMIKDTKTGDQALGFAFVGNVHVVDNTESDCVGGGLVGNNLSYEDDDQGESYAVVDTILYYCRDCAVEVLFGDDYELKKKEPYPRGTSVLA